MAAVKPFQIRIPDERLRKLKQKLELTEFPSELSDAGQRYGAPLADVQRLSAHWRTKFDWRAQEKKLNEIPQFTTDISVDGFGSLKIHFVRQTSGIDGAIPLLFVHGWPGSFIEVVKMLPLLKGGNGRPAFDVIAPSLPNFGFSSRVEKVIHSSSAQYTANSAKPGFNLGHYAEVCNKLMLALGYDQYVTQGGDWGHMITHVIGLLYPKHCKANHTNFPLVERPENMSEYASHQWGPHEQKMLQRLKWFGEEGQGYFGEQTTRPMTLSYGLRDSPVAVLAWIYEKLVEWTDKYPWTDDEVCTWISIYWFSRAGPDSSVYIYYEATHDESRKFGSLNEPVGIPVGLAYFPLEIAAYPELIARKMGNVKHVSYFDRGGHFAAWERPDDLAEDICKFYGKDGPIAGIVQGKSG